MNDTSIQGDVLAFLGSSPHQYFTLAEILQRFGPRPPVSEARLLDIILQMVRIGRVEGTEMNHFKCKVQRDNVQSCPISISPHLAAILRRSGKNFGANVLL